MGRGDHSWPLSDMQVDLGHEADPVPGMQELPPTLKLSRKDLTSVPGPEYL